MKITSLSDIEQIEKDLPLSQVITVDNTYSAIANSAKQRPEHTALSFFLTGDTHQKAKNISYGELLKKITQTANMLDGLGLKEDDVVAYILPNLPETHYVIWGGEAKCRILAINPLLEPSQIQSLLNSAKAKVLITMNPMPKMDLWQKVEQILPNLDTVQTVIGVDIAHYVRGVAGLAAKALQSVKKRNIDLPNNRNNKLRYIDFLRAIKTHNGDSLNFERTFTKDTISSLFCTGGTTGLPKIALRTHRNELVNATSVLHAAPSMLGMGRTILCGLPLFHVNATLITGLIPFMNGATVVLATPQGFRGKGVFEHFWQIVERFKVTTFSGVPTVYSTLLQHPVGDNDISSLEYCMCGAAPMPVEIFKNVETMIGVKLLEGYGLTEGTCVSSINPTGGETRVGSIGIRIPYQQMMCALPDENGTLLRSETDQVGSVYIRGENVFLGYTEPHQNEGLWHKDINGDIWLNTGDMGRQDQQGYFWLTGRQKELIIRAGHNIEPKIIEEAMCAHPGVAIAAAVGKPDIKAGELPVCYVQLLLPNTESGKTITEHDLLEYAKANVPERAAIPRAMHIIPELPLTAVGKIFKPKLQMLEIQKCVTDITNDLMPGIPCSVNVIQDKRLGLLACIDIEADPQQIEQLSTHLGQYTFKFKFEACCATP